MHEGNLRPGISWRWLVNTVLAPIGRGRRKWDTPMLSTFTLRPSGWTATSGESLPSFSDSMRSKANFGFKRRYRAREEWVRNLSRRARRSSRLRRGVPSAR